VAICLPQNTNTHEVMEQRMQDMMNMVRKMQQSMDRPL
jgi:diadenosine tetraphosphate (Ap4A) HIT family hydrolase